MAENENRQRAESTKNWEENRRYSGKCFQSLSESQMGRGRRRGISCGKETTVAEEEEANRTEDSRAESVVGEVDLGQAAALGEGSDLVLGGGE